MFLLGETVGKYQILANLGSGGFGTVFLARDTWIDKKVAIKVPHRQTGDSDELLAGAAAARRARPPEHRRRS